MKSKTFLITSIVLLSVFLVGLASAENIAGNVVTSLDDSTLSAVNAVALTVGDSAELRVDFTALKNAEDIRVEVELDGYRDDISAKTSRFDVAQGIKYSKTLDLELPSDIADANTKMYAVHVKISNSVDSTSADYIVQLERESYDLNILSVDYNTEAQPGEVVPFLVVVENTGANKIRNGYVTVSIPALGVSTRGYIGNLVSYETEDSDKVDSLQKTVYLQLPESAKAGLYEVVVQAYNADASTTVKKALQVGKEAKTIVPITTPAVSNGNTYVVALTVVLAIVFVVLFIVLIVLLTRKPQVEESETSYY